jgi:hypothetical protein
VWLNVTGRPEGQNMEAKKIARGTGAAALAGLILFQSALLEGHQHAPAAAFADVGVNVGSTGATSGWDTFRSQPAMPVEILHDTVRPYLTAAPVALTMSADELQKLLEALARRLYP